MDDNEDFEETVEEVVEVDPIPWHNSDTAAAAFMFASQLAAASAQHFQNLAMLALGQSAHEWLQNDRTEFADETVADILKLPETGGLNG